MVKSGCKRLPFPPLTKILKSILNLPPSFKIGLMALPDCADLQSVPAKIGHNANQKKSIVVDVF